MTVGHCPECGMPITSDGEQVQTCAHVPMHIAWLAQLLAGAFSKEKRNHDIGAQSRNG